MFLLCLYFKCLHVMILRSVLLLFMRDLCWRISLDQFFDISVINMRSLHFEQLVKPILFLCRSWGLLLPVQYVKFDLVKVWSFQPKLCSDLVFTGSLKRLGEGFERWSLRRWEEMFPTQLMKVSVEILLLGREVLRIHEHLIINVIKIFSWGRWCS